MSISTLFKSSMFAELVAFDQSWLIEHMYRMWLATETKTLDELNLYHQQMLIYHVHGVYLPTPANVVCSEPVRDIELGRQLVLYVALRRLRAGAQPMTDDELINDLATWLLKPPVSARLTPRQYYRDTVHSLLRQRFVRWSNGDSPSIFSGLGSIGTAFTFICVYRPELATFRKVEMMVDDAVPIEIAESEFANVTQMLFKLFGPNADRDTLFALLTTACDDGFLCF